jgi:hypothetical protein
MISVTAPSSFAHVDSFDPKAAKLSSAALLDFEFDGGDAADASGVTFFQNTSSSSSSATLSDTARPSAAWRQVPLGEAVSDDRPDRDDGAFSVMTVFSLSRPLWISNRRIS